MESEVHNIAQEAMTKTIPEQKKCKMVAWGGLTNPQEKKRSERQRRKSWMQNSRER